MGEGGHEPRPRAPAASRPSHERPGGRVPRPCRLATWQEGRVARILDDTGLIAIGVDRSVWLDARGEDGPGPLVGPVQRAWVHVPVRRPVEPFRQRTASRKRGSRSASRSSAGRASGWRSRRRGRARRARSCRAARWGGSTGRIRAPYMCTRPPSSHIAVPSPSHIPLACLAHQSECGRTPPTRGRHHKEDPSP